MLTHPAGVAPPQAGDKRKAQAAKGASSVSSGVRLENVAKARAALRSRPPAAAPRGAELTRTAAAAQAFKGADVLKDISWEVKKGERVGLVGWNGAGKTTQLKLITGEMEADAGSIIRAKSNMKIAFLNQEFEVVMTRTVRRPGRPPAEQRRCA